MKQAPIQKHKARSNKIVNTLNPAYYILLIAYILIPTYTPNLYTLDSNGPKFLALAILNLISFLYFMFDPEYKKRVEGQNSFFRNFIGIAYSAFIVLSLLSFFQAYNLSESIITFTKILSVFASSYVLFIIISSNRRYIEHVALAFVFLILFDCLTVFYHIIQYIGEEVSSIYDIKSVYSHKNILAAALFIKIPAAIWLMLFTDGWKKKLGYLAFALGSLAIFFMSSRAFYIGLFLLFIGLEIFLLTRYFINRNQLLFRKIILVAGIFIGAFLTFTFIQHFFYPTNLDTARKFNTGVVERLSTISSDESSANARLTNWKRSFLLIQDNPVLGVGLGNWKIEVLKYESPTTDGFIISYKNHNDFIEVISEIGIPGGLIYILIFILIFIYFIKKSITNKTDEETLKYLFFPAFGILAYCVDAFFNFPNDRPEIQTLFAVYLAMMISFSSIDFTLKPFTKEHSDRINNSNKSLYKKILLGIILALLGTTVYVLSINTKSLHFQRYIYEDMMTNRYSHPSSYYVEKLPSIPNLSSTGAPISTYISRYLINENQIDKAITLLKSSNPSPYDSRREYFLSMAYDKLRQHDSMVYWSNKTLELKPRFANMTFILSSRQFSNGDQKEAFKTLNQYLELVKDNPEAWLRAIAQQLAIKNETQASKLLDSALKYLPKDKKILEQKKALSDAMYIEPYKDLYNEAIQLLNTKNYTEAIRVFNSFLNKKPDYSDAYLNRAVCYFYTREYVKSMEDIETVLKTTKNNEAMLMNLRGLNKLGLNNTDEACADFKLAMDKGNADAATNYQKFCYKSDKK